MGSFDQLNESRVAPEFENSGKPFTRPVSSARVNIGIDFGTSFTKVCYRDLGTSRSGLIDFSNNGAAEITESMIPTKVGLIGDKYLLTGVPEECFRLLGKEQKLITQLKMRLATFTGDQNLREFTYGPSWPQYHESVQFLAALFLSNVIRLSKIHLLTAKADEFRNRDIEWSATVGVPVLLFDSPALAVFEDAFETAWLMAEDSNSPSLDLPSCWEQFLTCRNMRRERFHNRVYAIEPCSELCAAMVALVGHPTAQEGIYLFFDIGGGTLDGVSFRYFRRDGLPRIVLFEGRIGALGIEALVRKHPEWNATELRQALFSQDMSPVLRASLEPEADEIRQLVGFVVMRAKDFAGLQWIRGTTERLLPVLVGGGGSLSRFYLETIMSTHAQFGQAHADIPPYRLTEVPVADDFDMGRLDPRHFHRFAVAYGLSVPFGERPEMKLPSQVHAPSPPPMRPTTPVGVYDD